MEFSGQGDQQRAAEDGSSSPALSSPPRSPENVTPPNVPVHQNASRDKAFGVFNPAPATSQPNATSTSTSNLTAKGLPRKKPGRKPKDPNAPAQPPKPRKRVKTSDPGPAAAEAATAPKQPKITELVGQIAAPPPPGISSTGPGAPNHSAQTLGHGLPPATPRPASSGQLFDPVRGSTVPIETTHHASTHPSVSPNHQAQMANRASASPSIKSLIDPTPAIPTGTSRLAPPSNVTSAPVSPAPQYKHQPNANPFTGAAGSSILQSQPQTTLHHHTPMELDSNPSLNMVKKTEPVSTAPSSNAPTPPPQPKAPRAKEQPPPLPTGSGLLSATPFGPGAITNGSNATTTSDGTNIYLTFDLRNKQNTTINFAREVERKYGFAALHPRLAARKERQRQLAAAGAALERELGGVGASGDDMSLDVSEPPSEDEGPRVNGNGGGDETASAAGTGADGLPVKKKRRRRMEEYDRTDDFIDDTELLWEESALMAKDGFFVYSGPLVVEGAKMDIERSDGTVSKRGRGRGRGGASRGESSGRGSRGGGRGSRGGTTVRKPRVTKADRAMMEQEKLEREKMAATLAAKPPAGQAPLNFPLAGAPPS